MLPVHRLPFAACCPSASSSPLVSWHPTHTSAAACPPPPRRPPSPQLIITHITARNAHVRELLAAQGLILRQPDASATALEEWQADSGAVCAWLPTMDSACQHCECCAVMRCAVPCRSVLCCTVGALVLLPMVGLPAL